jgi:Flp pilus assembly protein TadG
MIRSLARDNRGQELVEYALTLPILLLLVLGIMEFGVAIFAYNTVANAAREGARVGAVLDGEFDEVMRDQIEDAVIARTGGLILTDNNIAITETVVYSPETSIRVTVNYTHTLITGLIMRAAGGDAQLQLRSEASMRREAPLREGS